MSITPVYFWKVEVPEKENMTIFGAISDFQLIEELVIVITAAVWAAVPDPSQKTFIVAELDLTPTLAFKVIDWLTFCGLK